MSRSTRRRPAVEPAAAADKKYQHPVGEKCNKCGAATAIYQLPAHGTWRVCISCNIRVKIANALVPLAV